MYCVGNNILYVFFYLLTIHMHTHYFIDKSQTPHLFIYVFFLTFLSIASTTTKAPNHIDAGKLFLNANPSDASWPASMPTKHYLKARVSITRKHYLIIKDASWPTSMPTKPTNPSDLIRSGETSRKKLTAPRDGGVDQPKPTKPSIKPLKTPSKPPTKAT